MSNNSFNFNIFQQAGLSRNIHKAGCAIWDMRYGMKKEKKTGSWVEDMGYVKWDVGIQGFGCWIYDPLKPLRTQRTRYKIEDYYII